MVKQWPWPLVHVTHDVLIQFTVYTNFNIVDFYSFWVIKHLNIIQYKCIWKQSCAMREKITGQPRIIIFRTLIVLEYSMLNTVSWSSTAEEEDFWRFLPYMGKVTILVLWPWMFGGTFFPPTHGGSAQYLASIGPVVSVEKMFENLDR